MTPGARCRLYDDNQTEYGEIFYFYIWEVPIFLGMGVLAGVLGAAFNSFHIKCAAWRAQYVPPRLVYRRLAEVRLFAVTLQLSFLMSQQIHTLQGCTRLHAATWSRSLQQNETETETETTSCLVAQCQRSRSGPASHGLQLAAPLSAGHLSAGRYMSELPAARQHGDGCRAVGHAPAHTARPALRAQEVPSCGCLCRWWPWPG